MVVDLFFFRFSVLDGKAITQHPFPLSALTSLPCIFQQFKKNLCRAVFLELHQHFPFLKEKYLINFSFLQRDLVFCFFSPWRWKIMRPLIFWFPQCMAHQNSSFYWVELNIILFFLNSENFEFSGRKGLYFRTEGVKVYVAERSKIALYFFEKSP